MEYIETSPFPQMPGDEYGIVIDDTGRELAVAIMTDNNGIEIRSATPGYPYDLNGDNLLGYIGFIEEVIPFMHKILDNC